MSIWIIFGLNLVLVLYLHLIIRALDDRVRHRRRALDRVRHRRRMERRSRPLFIRPSKFRPDLFGIQDHETRVLEFLERSTAPMLGISGMCGVGKTTLLRLIWQCYQEQYFFSYVFIADAGGDGFTADMLQGVIARGIGFGHIPDLGNGFMDAATCISTCLRDQSFLLLIDDVRASFDLAAAGLPKTLGPRQKVIFSTRDESICAQMGCAANTFRMNPFGEADAWNLFEYNVGAHIIDSNPIIKELAKEIVAKCRGFPKALLTVAPALSTEKLDPWIVANDSLSNSLPDNEGYPCLKSFKEEFCF